MDIYLKDKNVTLHTAKKYCEEDINVNVECDKLSIVPSVGEQTYSGIFDEVKIGPIPEEYLIPEGTIEIKENGDVDVSKYASANINVKSDRTPLKSKGVDFIDYDGTLLYSYTVEEAQALTELPELPTQKGLICQGWNWSLEDIKEHNRKLVIGATYITDDGKTRYYFKTNVKNIDVKVCFRQSIANGVELDWGDGSPIETFDEASYYKDIMPSHTYINEGDYIITLNPINTCMINFNVSSSSYTCLGNSDYYIRAMLQKVELGRNIDNIGGSFFRSYYNLSTITIPRIKGIILRTYTLNTVYRLKALVVPYGIIELDALALGDCKALNRLSIPNTTTYIGNSLLAQCSALKDIIFPNSVDTLKSSPITGDYSLREIFIPKKVLMLENTFVGANSITKFYFIEHEEIPTMSSTTTFAGMNKNAIIIVPDELYDEWIVATNWVSIADHIVKKSEVT